MTRAGRWRPAVAAAALAVAAAACGSAAAATKSGGPADPVELVLVNYDSGGSLRVVPAVARFKDRVEDLSNGHIAIRVEIPTWAPDGREVAAVAAGEADLGWVGTRAFDLLGVDELRPLHAPLLIDSYPLQAAVVGDDVVAGMLASLERLGVEPLGLLADGLRLPAAVERPLLAPDDWADARIWLLESGAYADAVAALGATPLHTFAAGDDIREMLQNGEADGAETMWNYYVLGGDYTNVPYVAANVSLGPRTVALFANPDSLGALDRQSVSWIRQAAAEAAAWSAGHASAEAARYMNDACHYGARVALASPAQLAALREVVEPAYARLRADPATADTFTRIEALKAEIGTAPQLAVPAGCRYQHAEELLRAARSAPLSGPGPTGAFPRGTYRYELPADAIVSSQDAVGSDAFAGVATWRMGAGDWTLTLRPREPGIAPLVCDGWYAVDGETVTFGYRPQPEGHCVPMRWTARWAVGDDGALHWGAPDAAVLAPHFSGQPWRRLD